MCVLNTVRCMVSHILHCCISEISGKSVTKHEHGHTLTLKTGEAYMGLALHI